MKYGMRTPSPRKSFSARTTGKATRSIKKAINPSYGKKGVGMIKDPERAFKNKIYRKTTYGISDITRSLSKSSSYDFSDYSYEPTSKTKKKTKSKTKAKTKTKVSAKTNSAALELTDGEKRVAAVIINGLRQNGCDTQNLGLYKDPNGYVELVDGYPYIRFRITKTMSYVLLPKTIKSNDAAIKDCPAYEGSANARLMFNNLRDLVSRDKLLTQIYRDSRNKRYDSGNLKAASVYSNSKLYRLSESEIVGPVVNNGGNYWTLNAVQRKYGETTKLVDDKNQPIQYDNAKQTGYGVDSGRQHAQAEIEPIFTETESSYQAQEKTSESDSGSCLIVFMWIFFFPVMLNIWILRSDKLNSRTKTVLIFVLWALLIGVLGLHPQ